MTGMLTLEEAWDRLLALAAPLESEIVALSDCPGRFLAQPLLARRTQPSRDLSAMDGFAVAGPGPWRVVGESRAGADFGASLQEGEAVAISTGAACPPGTSAILIIEDADRSGEQLAARAEPSPGFIRRRGFDVAEGDVLLAAGRRIGPAQGALARAAGHASLAVVRQPRVAVIECGDELFADPADCPADRLPASNGAMVAALLQGLATPRQLGPLPDDRAALVEALHDCADADVIVTTAGASVGEHDHVKAALEAWGARLDFWKVAIRPGKPLLVARKGAQIVIGLPGNPNSAFVTAFLFLVPLLRALQGAENVRPTAIPLPLASPLPAGASRREFLRGRFVEGQAVPLPERDSSALRTLAAADLLIDRPINAPAAQPGDSVPAYWIGNG